MAAGGGGLLRLWTECGIQIMVVLSFALQVLLLIFGGMRRRGLSAWQSAAVWFAYLMADSTAIYALGHLSVTSEHLLQAFWAPFLLLHLGGPHNITAYSLEDNRLWLRHLQTLVVQAVGVAYVLCKYMVGSGTLLLLASVSMFIVGLAKYGERTWALRCANRSSTDEKTVIPHRLLTPDMGDEEILLRAHALFHICRCLFNDHVDAWIPYNSLATRPFEGEDIFKLMEMELSLMYDTLYTKAPVIYTWYGLCIQFVSLVGISVALCLFQFSISREGNNNRNG